MSATISHLNGGDARSGKLPRRAGSEPLERFRDAKKSMGEIYKDLSEFISELHDVYAGMEADHKLPKSQTEEVEGYRDSIRTIIEMFSRDKMKVVFFGRTSNGKSTVINAMLHSKVLPQGMGHTTCCFLRVEGGSENDKHFMMEEGDERYPIEELHKAGHALSTENNKLKNMGQDSLLRIFYPKSCSKLLQNDVVLLDSPGVDLSPEFDSWIDKHCLDADVFVLVSNSESTLTQAEKNFFLRVSRKLSQPNVFILNNRWDASASESDSERQQVRGQHEKRFVQFLVDELKVCSREEAENRFFFISAREMLDARLKQKGEISKVPAGRIPATSNGIHDLREHKTISKSAIRTKFESHARRAREIIQCLGHNIDTVRNNITQERHRLALESELRAKEFVECREKFAAFEKNYYGQQQTVRAEVHLKVAADFAEEISRLESIIDRFSEPFGDEPEQIAAYKENLTRYIEKQVTSNLEDKCTGGLMSRIWSLENEMFQKIQEVLGDQYAPKLEQLWRYKQPFKFSIIVDCHRLLEDFHEDLEFHFSFGVDALIRRLIAFSRGRPVTSIGRNHFSVALQHQQPGNPMRNQKQGPQQQEHDQFMVEMIRSSASYLANGSIGLVIVGTLVYKSVGWKIIASGAAVYGGLYAIERLRWNASAKEQHLKDQIRSHLSVGMRQMSGIHTSQCEAQVTRELNQAHHGLKVAVGGVHQEMKTHCDELKQRISSVDEVVKLLGSLKGKTSFVSSSVDAFCTKFLTSD
ncbi:Transmembrane GTPase fzo-1 [Aphelenchoides fujianensis]|nr:Transmembrane GTPase fzo-1 [Aphelenchoides fujianensis]